jgi:23S rRNA-/tRNA-specific pseudouridylate synthase
LYSSKVETASKLHKMLEERKIIKQYLAITKNVPSLEEGEIDIPLIRRSVNEIERVSYN